MLRLAYFAALGVLLIGTSAEATEQVVVVAARPANDPNEMICKMMEPKVGSRLGGGRVCQTRHMWDERRQMDRELTEDAQMRKAHGDSGWW